MGHDGQGAWDRWAGCVGHDGRGAWDMTGGVRGTRWVGCMGRNGQGMWDDPATRLLGAAWIGDILEHVFRDIFWCGQDERLALALLIEGVVTGIVSFHVHRV